MGIPKITLAGGGERAQYLVHQFNDNTIRFVLNYPGLVDPDVLRAAARAVVESVDILHGTFFTDSLSAYWNINKEVEETSYFAYIRTEGDPAVTAYSLALLPVHPEGKAQLVCRLVQSGQASAVAVSISHLCVDGGDGKYLLAKLVEAYNRILESGTAEGLEIKNGNRAPEKVYEKLGVKDFKELISNPLSGEKTVFPYPDEEPGMVRLARAVIPAEVMTAARKKAKAVGSTANDLLVTAFYYAYASLPGVDGSAPMSVSSMMDLRKHCKDGESEGLANMSGALPTTLENGLLGSFDETLAEITRQNTAAKEDPLAGLKGMPIMHGMVRAVPVWLLQMAIGKVYGSMSVGLTNLGNLPCQDFALGELVPNGGMMGGPLKKKPGMQVSVISFDGECVLSVVGQFTAGDEELLSLTLERMVRAVTDYAEDGKKS